MATYHAVKQGEYLSLIAKQYGFASHSIIWDHEKNADLRAKRKNPSVLFPDDQVFIPDKVTKNVSINTEVVSKFQLKRDKLMLRLVVRELYGKPLATTECEVHVDGGMKKVVANDDGLIEVEVPLSAQRAELIIKEKDSQLKEITIPIQIGHLDPVDTVSGQKARLNNLGYFAGSLDKEDEALFQSGVEEFQCDHKLTVDGKCGPKTQSKLREIHGC